jgi:rhodanese-related sulfurtransferase
MGTHLSSMNKVSFEDVQWFIKGKSEKYLLINTLDIKDQCCLIKETIDIDREVTIINDHLNNKKIRIIIYGRNANDESIAKKYQQFLTLGFTQIYIYPGGLFEWLCLQDIYGYDKFPTRGKLLDILKFKPISQISGKYLLKNN